MGNFQHRPGAHQVAKQVDSWRRSMLLWHVRGRGAGLGWKEGKEEKEDGR